MKKQPIVLLGAGGHAKACIDVIEQNGCFKIIGLLGSSQQVGQSILGYRVLGDDGLLSTLRADCVHALVAVGQITTPELRVRLFMLLKEYGFILPAVVSSRAYVSAHALLGDGTIVMHGAVVNAGAVVGKNCIINNQSLIEHDVMVGDHCHISTSAVLNGDVQVGIGTFIGSGSIVRESIVIGSRCMIGMGQRIIFDCPSGSKITQKRIYHENHDYS